MESYRQTSPDKRQAWDQRDSNTNKEESGDYWQYTGGPGDSDADKYLVDRQTSTTDFHLYSTGLREHKDEMANPYLDRGYKMPYEISQNRYKEHVLGSKYENYNQHRPEALDGYPLLLGTERPLSNRTIPEAPERRHHDPHPQHQHQQYDQQYNSPRYDRYEQQQRVQEPPRPQYYGDSPRRDYEQRTHRAGRPDLGFEKDTHVPYPQEPMRRSRHDYEQPPDIGFNPHREEPQQQRQFAMEDPDDNGPSHPGWILLLRFNKDGEHEVRKGLTFATQIAKDGGRVLGMARSYGIKVLEGGDGWVTFGRMIFHRGGSREIQQSPVREESMFSVLAIYYPSLRKAQEWFDRDYWFKQKDFPSPYCLDCIALPLSTAIDVRQCKTLVLSEYPRITNAELFRTHFSEPTEKLMKTKFRATPYVVKAFYIPTTDPTQRVARHFRGSWLSRNSVITMSCFGSSHDCDSYFKDGEYRRAREFQDQVSAPTTIMMDLEPNGGSNGSLTAVSD